MNRAIRNSCKHWHYTDSTLNLCRRDDYLIRACFVCGNFRDCFGDADEDLTSDRASEASA